MVKKTKKTRTPAWRMGTVLRIRQAGKPIPEALMEKAHYADVVIQGQEITKSRFTPTGTVTPPPRAPTAAEMQEAIDNEVLLAACDGWGMGLPHAMTAPDIRGMLPMKIARPGLLPIVPRWTAARVAATLARLVETKLLHVEASYALTGRGCRSVEPTCGFDDDDAPATRQLIAQGKAVVWPPKKSAKRARG